MKKVSRRALFALALAIVLAAGTLAFCVKYAVNADKWVTFSGSPHVYTGTNLTGGKIYDRTGARILNTTDGRVYSSDAAVRAATVHLLGDRYGYISAPLLGNFAEQMIAKPPRARPAPGSPSAPTRRRPRCRPSAATTARWASITTKPARSSAP